MPSTIARDCKGGDSSLSLQLLATRDGNFLAQTCYDLSLATALESSGLMDDLVGDFPVQNRYLWTLRWPDRHLFMSRKSVSSLVK